MKVIFLDVDGVLNAEHWYIANHKKHPEKCRVETAIDPRFVKNLRKIVKKTGAKIVLSATCRGSVKQNKKHYLHKILAEYGLSIYDYTLRLGVERGYEIQDWLDKHKDITNIVILDDDDDMIHLSKYLVKTNISNSRIIPKHPKTPDERVSGPKYPFAWYFTEGLSSYKTKMAIKILNKPYVNIYKIKNKHIGRAQF